ncbi:hypothetical protein BHYA_0180g00150 [Botrytis hyacinthi]|uniref:Uncharacterized protein n=1 Tax=Botrytis hyacinthi TaxID=278943 RepID=A0A4Z1GFD1_9HELO|nr:hypothetical protein BHYA_0180g00150 [Botrytis hyacinthi]
MFRREQSNEGKLVLLRSQIEFPILGKYRGMILRKRIVYKVYPNSLFSELNKSVRPLKWIDDCPRVVGVDLAWPVRRSKLA